MSPVVAVLEPFDAAMQAKVREIVGDGLTLVFPKSAEFSDLIEAVQQAEFAVVRAIKMPASLLTMRADCGPSTNGVRDRWLADCRRKKPVAFCWHAVRARMRRRLRI